MSNRNLTKVFLLVALLGLSLVPFSQAHPKRGRKRAFGVGLLGGALAGGIIGNVMAKSHQAPAAAPAVPVAQVHHFYPAGAPIAPAPIVVAAPAQPDPKKMTVIETGTPDANGCYTQTVREPNPNNPKSYTETQHLICPTLKQANQPAPAIASAPSAAHVPVMPQPSPVIPAHVAGPPAPAPVAAPAAAPAAAPVIPVVPVGVAPGVPAPAPVPAAAAPAPVPAAVAPAPAPVAPVVPVAIPAPVPAVPAVQPNAGQPQVILLSKKTVYYPKKRSAAPTLNIPQGVLAVLVIFYTLLL
ncbi:predicted GPI-anchored protein 58 [Drosophila elegans]|uniref:predicted GPI-anchored protein 58 n=1 Tax=Drosophila elegans TaxID=30023 RepID=UPI001BC85F21|nr:predicted GPI-anchored protein 58 [Drosophila elegans]